MSYQNGRTPREFTVRFDDSDACWLVSEPGDDKPQVFAAREEAVEAAKKLAQGYGPSRLRILATEGSVESEIEYDADPVVTQLEKFGF